MESAAESEVIAEPDEEVQSLSLLGLTLQFLQQNGWYILFLGLVLQFIWSAKLKKYFEEWIARRQADQESASIHKDPNAFIEKERARLAAIEKMQEQYKKDAEIYAAKLKEKEEKKKEEWIKKNSEIGGRKLNSSSKDEYSPLSGGGGAKYRPPRRSGCSGGSCGGS